MGNGLRWALLGTIVLASLPLATTDAASVSDKTVTKVSSNNTALSGDVRTQLTEAAPDWAQRDLRSLAAAGYLVPTQLADISSGTINRQEGAILTARAYHFLQEAQTRQGNASDSLNAVSSSEMMVQNGGTTAAAQQIQTLMQEFAPELEALGYGSESLVASTRPSDKALKGVKAYGEVRYSYMHNSGDKGFNYNISGLRTHLYVDAPINWHWTAHTLIEGNSHNRFGDDAGSARGSDTNWKFSRYYLEGTYTWSAVPFDIKMGQASAFLANGTVLDTNFKGGLVTITPRSDTTVSVGRGIVNTNQKLTFVEGIRRQGVFDYMGGYYYWDRNDDTVGILYGGLNYYYGNYTLTGQYFMANRGDGSGTKNGYTGTIRYGKNFSWIKNTYEWDLDFYDLAGTNYVNHTMNGLGNSMNGFSGWSVRTYYTPVKNVMVSLQYYDLEDKTTKKAGRTLWSEISWNFG